MGITKPHTEAESLVGQLQLARIQLAKSECTLTAAREAARTAKHRRREAKLAARRARKEVKRGKAELSEAREAMARIEAKVAAAGLQRLRKRDRARYPARDRQARSHPRRVPVRTRTVRPVTGVSSSPAGDDEFTQAQICPPGSSATREIPSRSGGAQTAQATAL